MIHRRKNRHRPPHRRPPHRRRMIPPTKKAYDPQSFHREHDGEFRVSCLLYGDEVAHINRMLVP
jgi:hypothetical protein